MTGIAFRWTALLLLALQAQETAPKTAARTPGEIKAMVQLLAPRKGASMQEVYLARVRQYRYLCGVPFESLAFDPKQGELAHAGASICARLNKLTHNPERPAGMSDAEYQLGKDGAGQCNLFAGLVEPAACVDGWMDDSDPSNIDRVGHRRWILNPSMGKSAFGTVGNYAAMYAFDGSNKKVPDWDLVTYPARGVMPVQFFGARHAWSISPNPKKYVIPAQSELKVTIHAADAKQAPLGEPLKLDYFHLDTGGFGSGPAVIFRPQAFAPGTEGAYVVTLTGLKSGGEAAQIRYVVNFTSLQRIPDGPEGAATYSRYYQNRFETIQALPEKLDQVEALGDFLEADFLRQADPKIRTGAQKALAELIKEPELKREHDAAQRHKLLLGMEQKAGKSKNQLVPVVLAYRDMARVYKETRAGARAAADFERLKEQLQ